MFREQTEVCGGDLTLPLNYEQVCYKPQSSVSVYTLSLSLLLPTKVKEFEQLDRCLKETLRLRPPIMTMMRNVRVSQVNELVVLLVFQLLALYSGRLLASSPFQLDTRSVFLQL